MDHPQEKILIGRINPNFLTPSETFAEASMETLANYGHGFTPVNIFVTNGAKIGILIRYLDMETKSRKRVKVLVAGKFEYWTDAESTYVKTEERKFERIN